jgi:hypothetical protein
MRDLEERLGDAWQPIRHLAADIFGSDPPTPSQIESVRRAGHCLVDQGRAEVDRLRFPVGHPRHSKRGDGTTIEVYREQTMLGIKTAPSEEELRQRAIRAGALREALAELRR